MIRQPASAALPVAAPATDVAARPSAVATSEAAPAETAGAGQARARVSADEVRRAKDEANERLRLTGSELTFEFNDEVGRVVVRLVDTRTREVLRQFPSEEMLQIARALKQDKPAGALLRAAA